MISDPQNGPEGLPATKRCSKCSAVKPLDDFSRDRRNRDGRQVHCKACDAARKADRYRRRKAEGGCTKCSAPAVDDQVLCAEHRAEQAARNAAYRASPEGRAKWAAYIAAGKNAERQRARLERLRSRTPAEVETDRRRLRPDGRKRCRACGRALPLGEFNEDVTRGDGLQASCRACHNARTSGRLIRRALPRWEELDVWSCVYCGGEFEEVDHVAPRALGGSDDPGNLVPACLTCNRSKSDRQVVDWITERWPEVAEILDRLPWRVEAVDDD